jgi:hypothetical protein
VSRKKHFGVCHLCGDFGELSFEHVPPRAAFNERPVIARKIDEILKAGSWETAKGKIFQRGAGAYTLCERCNNNTGVWYGRDFVEWVYQGMTVLQAADQCPTFYYNFHIFPLRVIKQIACMFFSVNPPEFQRAQPALAKFVLDKENRHLPHGMKVYLFYSVGNNLRQSGVVHLLDLHKQGATFAEICFPPYGYVLSFDNPPHPQLLDISNFSEARFNTFTSLSFQIPVLPVITYYPGDYRSPSQIRKQFEENQKSDKRT